MATGKVNIMPTTHETLLTASGNETLGITRSGKMRIINFDFTAVFPEGRTNEITLAQSDRPLLLIRAPVFLFDGSAKVFAFVEPNGTMGFYNILTETLTRGVGELVYAVN